MNIKQRSENKHHDEIKLMLNTKNLNANFIIIFLKIYDLMIFSKVTYLLTFTNRKRAHYHSFE